MPYPASIYNVVKALEDNEAPITIDEVITCGEIIDDAQNRIEVSRILKSLVSANLAGKVLGKFRHDRKESFTIDYFEHTGVTLNTPDNIIFLAILHEQVCFQIKYLIEFNDDMGAYKLACEYLIMLGKNAQPLLDLFNAVESLCKIEGYTPVPLNQYKRDVAARLFKLAESSMSEKSYKIFQGSF